GGEETPFEKEDRKLVQSPKVATYDLQPEMSARGVADIVVSGIEEGPYSFILVNFANPDMVGHTGSIPAAVKAVEAVDACMADILDALRAHPEWVALITADHGNCEKMIDESGHVHTAHTTEKVDFVVFDPEDGGITLQDGGRLADVAPTVLGYMEIEPPAEMTGHDLVASR
ncbi:MAG: alkaline phosphatase family protein, partial [Gemmatimonadota bacterium]